MASIHAIMMQLGAPGLVLLGIDSDPLAQSWVHGVCLEFISRADEEQRNTEMHSESWILGKSAE